MCRRQIDPSLRPGRFATCPQPTPHNPDVRVLENAERVNENFDALRNELARPFSDACLDCSQTHALRMMPIRSSGSHIGKELTVARRPSIRAEKAASSDARGRWTRRFFEPKFAVSANGQPESGAPCRQSRGYYARHDRTLRRLCSAARLGPCGYRRRPHGGGAARLDILAVDEVAAADQCGSGFPAYSQSSPYLGHALPDGTYSFDDATAREYLRQQCPARPKSFGNAQAIWCAKAWGVDEKTLRLAAHRQCVNDPCKAQSTLAACESLESAIAGFKPPLTLQAAGARR